VCLNCQFDPMESGQSPDGLDATHITAAALSLIALAVLERGPAIVGQGTQDLAAFPLR